MEIRYYQKFHRFISMSFFENSAPPLTQSQLRHWHILLVYWKNLTWWFCQSNWIKKIGHWKVSYSLQVQKKKDKIHLNVFFGKMVFWGMLVVILTFTKRLSRKHFSLHNQGSLTTHKSKRVNYTDYVIIG